MTQTEKMAKKIILKAPGDLIPYEFNNKIHDEKQINLIANSISELGFQNPILIDEQNVIIAGHWRLEAAKKLQLAHVPCIVVTDLTKAQIKKLRILDNRIGDFAQYDKDALRTELAELWDWGLYDLFLWRWLEKKTDKEEVEDNVPLLSKSDIIVKPGQLFKLWDHYLLCWDTTDTEAVKKFMGNVMADCIFTDPPYNVNYKWMWKKTSRGIENDHMSSSDFDVFLDKVFATYYEVVKKGGGMYCFHSTSTQAQFQKHIEKNWFEIKNQLIWNKPMAALWRWDYRRKHEPFFYCGIKNESIQFYGDRTHSTVVDSLKDKSDKEILKIIKAAKEAEKNGMTTIRSMKRENVSEYVHPTQKPIELIQYALTNSTKIWDVVVDFFQWSGATLIACEKMSRVCYWIEMDPFFVQTIIARYHYYTDWEKEIRCLNDDTLSINDVIDAGKK